jgi:hypothetical protein
MATGAAPDPSHEPGWAELRQEIKAEADRTAAAVEQICAEGSVSAVWAAVEALCALRETWTRLTPKAVAEEEGRRLLVRAADRAGAARRVSARHGRGEGRLAAVRD